MLEAMARRTLADKSFYEELEAKEQRARDRLPLTFAYDEEDDVDSDEEEIDPELQR